MMAACSTLTPPATLRSVYGLRPPSELTAHRTALIFVDFQQEFVDGGLPLPDAAPAIAQAEQLLRWARANGIFVVHVRNIAALPDAPLFRAGSRESDFIAALAPLPSETVITKSLAGGFSKTNLESVLRERGIERVIVAGFMTHLAVDTTVRDATVLGFQAIVASDATATRDLPLVNRQELQRSSLGALADRFADVMAVNEICALSVK